MGACLGKGVQALLKNAQQHTMATALSVHLRIVIQPRLIIAVGLVFIESVRRRIGR